MVPSYESDSDTISNDETPLLRPSGPSRPGTARSMSFIRPTHSKRVIIGIVICIVFILGFGGFLMAVPGMRLYEDIICHHYYDKLEGDAHIGFDGDIREELCKIEPVQEELNILLAGQHFLGAIPSLIVTIPYGLLADKIGRKPVFGLALTGLILGACWEMTVVRFWTLLPLRMIWLSPIFTLIGGGEGVASLTFFAIATDIVKEADRANVFLLAGSASLLGELIGPSVASFLMIYSPWVPLLLGTGTLIFGTLLILFIPETLHLRPQPTASAVITPDNASAVSNLSDRPLSRFTTLKAGAFKSLSGLSGSLSVLHSLPVLLLLICFIILPFARQSVDLCVRYVSNRFGWRLRTAGYLLSLRAFINIILLLGILPLLSHILTHRLRWSSVSKDLVLARSSSVFLVIGSMLIAASPTIGLTIIGLIIWTLGTGFVALTRSLITTCVDQEHVGRLYAIISIVETAGALAAGPTLASLYTYGLKRGGPWVGLPFFCLSIVSMVSATGIWTFGCLRRKNSGYQPVERDEREEEVDTVMSGLDNAEIGVINV